MTPGVPEPDESDEELLTRVHEASVAQRRPGTLAWMAADIATELARIENHNEFIRVAEEDEARRAAARDVTTDIGRRTQWIES
jgi:hypothetical protein